MLLPTELNLSYQQPQQVAYQLGTTPVAPMQLDTISDAHLPTGPGMPEQQASAAAQVSSEPARHAQQSEQAQQALPTELAQHASTAAAVPSSLLWGLFSAPATMQGSVQLPGALAPSTCSDPQQHQPAACEEMPEKAVPDNTTWMQLYSAASNRHGQGILGQPSRQDGLAQPWAHAVCAGAGALPPALAQQDPNTGQWVPTLMPLNPFVIDQLAKTEGTPTSLTGQPQPSPEGLLVTAYPNGSRAVASKKRSRASRQLPLSGEPVPPVSARALPAVDRPVLDRMYEGTPAQLASPPNPPDCMAAGDRTVRMLLPGNDAVTGYMHKQQAADSAQLWHSQMQANSSMPSSHTYAGPKLTPPAPDDVIDLCSPTAGWRPQRQQNGCGPQLHETAAHSQLWHYGKQPTAETGAAPQQPMSRLHKELTEFAVMASATQVGFIVLSYPCILHQLKTGLEDCQQAAGLCAAQ